MRTVIVGVEDVTHDDAALAWATKAAADRDAELHLVHATGFPTLAAGLMYDDEVVRAAETTLNAAAERVAALSGVHVTTTVDRRQPAEALADHADTAELLVIGTHRLSAVERVFSGSLAYQIASVAPCPTVVVPRPVPADATGIVVGVDGSADSVAAVGLAAAEADRTGQPLHAIHAWLEPGVYATPEMLPLGTVDALREAEQMLLGESVAGLAERYPDLPVDEKLVQDQPATALLSAAEHARLLVVGSRGRHGLTRLLLGSVSHTIVLHAPCPVMVVRPHRRQSGAHR